MEYKVGDKVRIRTWEDMEEEYEIANGCIRETENSKRYWFVPRIERILNETFPDRILTIKDRCENYYIMKDIHCKWQDYMIKCLAKDYKKPIFLTRYDLMDLED